MVKNGPKFGKDYFDELLVKIKEIRASERKFYQKITDIYKECSNYLSQEEITELNNLVSMYLDYVKLTENKILC